MILVYAPEINNIGLTENRTRDSRIASWVLYPVSVLRSLGVVGIARTQVAMQLLRVRLSRRLMIFSPGSWWDKSETNLMSM